jgi:hypothetical protein
VEDKVRLLVERHSDILAIILYGSLARHAEIQHLDAPREVNVMFSTRSSREWDPDFIENVKRDGIILYQRGKLPAHFAA